MTKVTTEHTSDIFSHLILTLIEPNTKVMDSLFMSEENSFILNKVNQGFKKKHLNLSFITNFH